MSDAAILGPCGAVARRLLRDDEEPVLLHGDLHQGNVLASARGWLAIDPKGVMVSAATRSPISWAIPSRTARSCAIATACSGSPSSMPRALISMSRVFLPSRAHAGLSACWSMEDGDDAGYRLTRAAILDPLVA